MTDERVYADRAEYLREYSRRWKARRKAEFFADKVCEECGTDEDLQVDHIIPRRGSKYRQVWLMSKSQMDEEMKLCQILCRTHHAEKTIRDMEITHGFKPYTHGTFAMYHRHKCRCEPCKTFYSKWQAKYR